MKAIRFVGIEQPAQIADVPAPRPGFGEVVVAVEAAGLEILLCLLGRVIPNSALPIAVGRTGEAPKKREDQRAPPSRCAFVPVDLR